MSLFTNETAPDSKTAEELAAEAAARIRSSASHTFHMCAAAQSSGIRMLWNNPSATPQQICDALGSDAGKVFAGHGALTDLIVKLYQLDGKTPSVALPPNAFTVAEDGKVTISTEPYTP